LSITIASASMKRTRSAGLIHRVSGSERHVNRPAMSAASAQRWRFSKDSMRLRRN
jgi:hypothetical protein